MTSAGSHPVDFVKCGQAVMRVWLAAEMAGLSVHPTSPLFIYAHGEENFLSLVGTRYAARLGALAASFRQLYRLNGEEQLGLVLRLSHAEPASIRSLRLPLDAVLAPAHTDRRTSRRHRSVKGLIGAEPPRSGTIVAEPPARFTPPPPPEPPDEPPAEEPAPPPFHARRGLQPLRPGVHDRPRPGPPG